MRYTVLSAFLLVASSLAFLSHRFNLVSSRFLFLKGLILYSIALFFCYTISDTTLLDTARAFELSLDFNDLIIHGLLSYLLFAGALHLNMQQFMKSIREISVLALVSTSLATLLSASLLFYCSASIGVPVSWLACLLFAACISPTDPIAVLALLKSVHLPPAVSTKIAGESLLNDGVGIVFFTTFLQLIGPIHSTKSDYLLAFFLQQAGGGIFVGVVLAYLASMLLCYQRASNHDNAKQDIYWSLALVNATYLTSLSVDVSPALACVAAGLTSASRLQNLPPSRFNNLLSFWDIVDDILNTALFFLTGTFIFALEFTPFTLWLSISAIVIVLLSRLISVTLPMSFFHAYRGNRKSLLIAFSGLKGGLSLALALSIPSHFSECNLVVLMTFSVVAFTLLVQSQLVSWIAQKKP